jgi:uncharacterized damage-inducible protein DinB
LLEGSEGRRMMNQKLESNKYAPYYSTYVKLVPEGEILHILMQQMEESTAYLRDLTEQQARFSYGDGKWTIKEVIGHVADTERIMAYRLLSFARGETVELPGYDDNNYVKNALFNEQSVQQLLQNLMIVRQSTIHLIKSLPSKAYLRRGKANGSEVTVRALMYIIAGHELHHRKIIKQRYMGSEHFPGVN